MLELILLVVRSFGVARRGHKDLVLENMALRQQCRVLQRTARPRFRARDRMFWVLLARRWRSWRSALVVVQPETVIRWHREWLRRRWARRPAATVPDVHRWILTYGN